MAHIWFFFFAFLGSNLPSSLSQVQEPIVAIPGLGTVEGVVLESYFEPRPVYEFRAIPYAKPPVRFMPPEIIETLGDGVFNATKYGSVCPQNDIVSLPEAYGYERLAQLWAKDTDVRMSGDENCLHLNVYTTTLDSNASLPVMVYIHGGAFSSGFSEMYGASKFMHKDVVFIVIQYRLGVLGFLNLEVDEVAGNTGLLDQRMALIWIQQYIKSFGGNPDEVTIMGQSAGAASVHYHMLSPLSKGLFKRAISLSGTAILDWAFTRDPQKVGLDIAKFINCSQETLELTVQCLQEAPLESIIEGFGQWRSKERRLATSSFGFLSPSIQTAGSQRILEKDPLEIMESGDFNHVPFISGATKHEGSFIVGDIYIDYINPNNLLNNSYFFKWDYIPTLLNAFRIDDRTRAVTDSLNYRYLQGVDYNDATTLVNGSIDFSSTFFIKGGGYRVVQINSQYNDSYWYAYHYKGRYSLYGTLDIFAVPYTGGMGHGDDLILMFNFPLIYPQRDLEAARKLVGTYTNFAIYGNPTPEGLTEEGVPNWPKYDLDEDNFLEIAPVFNIRSDYPATYAEPDKAQ